MKKVVPKAKPSHRQKKRYVLFQYAGSRSASFQGINELVKSIGLPLLCLVEFNSADGKGIVRCERGYAGIARKTLNELGLKTIKTSGSLKKLRQRP